MSSIQTSQSLKRYAENVLWIGGVLGLMCIVLWPIMLVVWLLTYLYYRSILTQIALLSRLETIESLLTKEAPEVAEVPQTEAVQES